MDLRNSALVVALYLSGAVLVIGTAWAYLVWQRPADVPKLDVAEGTIELDRRPVVPAGRYAATVSRSSPTLAELQAALTVTRGKLDQTTLALHRKSAECRALKVELDNSLMMLANLLADEGGQLPDDAGPQRDAGESRKSVQDKLASELEQLAVGKSEQLDAERERQLAQLQDQLMQADVELPDPGGGPACVRGAGRRETGTGRRLARTGGALWGGRGTASDQGAIARAGGDPAVGGEGAGSDWRRGHGCLVRPARDAAGSR